MHECILHGEVSLIKVLSIPKDATRVQTKGKYHIIANSEVSFNHHVIDVKDGVEFYEKDGVLYLKNDVETQVRCLMTERHDNIVLDPGIWEIDRQQEYDYYTESHRNVSD